MRDRSVKIVGSGGGIGTPLTRAVVQFLAFGYPSCKVFLVDGDAYEERNRTRVLFDAPGNKAVVQSQQLSEVLGGVPAIVPIPRYLTPRNAHRLIEERDVVFLCVDNHASRKAVADSVRRRQLSDIVLISGGNDGVEKGRQGTFGNVMVYIRQNGRDVTNPLTRFHAEIAKPHDKRPDQLGCGELAHSAPQLLLTNLAVAAAMLNPFYGWLSGQLDYEELFLDIGKGRMNAVKRRVASPAHRRPRAQPRHARVLASQKTF
ncbi:MAG TPA: ThiF family adenylyltransferase [Bryobacteraceae bacterium]|nr:ThiF family adenylyltransferase [Bryobacteraceae bacterium]